MLSDALSLPAGPIHSHRHSPSSHFTSTFSLTFALLLLNLMLVPHAERDCLLAEVEQLRVRKRLGVRCILEVITLLMKDVLSDLGL